MLASAIIPIPVCSVAFDDMQLLMPIRKSRVLNCIFCIIACYQSLLRNVQACITSFAVASLQYYDLRVEWLVRAVTGQQINVHVNMLTPL